MTEVINLDRTNNFENRPSLTLSNVVSVEKLTDRTYKIPALKICLKSKHSCLARNPRAAPPGFFERNEFEYKLLQFYYYSDTRETSF